MTASTLALRRTQNGIRVALVHRDDNRRIGGDNFPARLHPNGFVDARQTNFSDILPPAVDQSWFSEGLPVVVSGLPIL